MTTVVGVRFRTAGKVYYFDPGELAPARDSHVIVETAQGLEFGTVVLPRKEVADEKVTLPLKKVLRMATEKDEETERDNRAREKEAIRICKERVQKHELEMKLTGCEYTFDRNKLLFYFTADGRVDFRELVKDLATTFHTRIELRQIGVRDEAKIAGGIGVCGRELCCATFLSDFSPVSIKMAKEQNLSLNPTKISGMCGRLMCCLNHEEEAYEFLNAKMPAQGDRITTPDGLPGQVVGVNVLRQRVRVLVTLREEDDEKEMREYAVEELSFTPRGRKKGKKKKDKEKDKEVQAAPVTEEAEEDIPVTPELEELMKEDPDTLEDITDITGVPAGKEPAKEEGQHKRRRRNRKKKRPEDAAAGENTAREDREKKPADKEQKKQKPPKKKDRQPDGKAREKEVKDPAEKGGEQKKDKKKKNPYWKKKKQGKDRPKDDGARTEGH